MDPEDRIGNDMSNTPRTDAFYKDGWLKMTTIDFARQLLLELAAECVARKEAERTVEHLAPSCAALLTRAEAAEACLAAVRQETITCPNCYAEFDAALGRK